MPNENLFDPGYVGNDIATDAPKVKSQTKQFLKQPIGEDDLKRYGSSKPSRIVIRAKLING
jgi:hypothetical protein